MQRAFPSYLADDASDASRLTGEVFQHLGIDPDASRYLALPGRTTLTGMSLPGCGAHNCWGE